MYSPNSKNFQVPDIAIIRPAKKALPYSIIPIGGAKELAQWKKDQVMLAEARDLYLKPIREATRLRAISMVANQNADTTLDAVALAELAHIKARDSKASPVTQTHPKYEVMETSPSLKAKIWTSLSNLWKAAFPE